MEQVGSLNQEITKFFGSRTSNSIFISKITHGKQSVPFLSQSFQIPTLKNHSLGSTSALLVSGCLFSVCQPSPLVKHIENECFILDAMVSTLSVHPQISDKHETTKSSQ